MGDTPPRHATPPAERRHNGLAISGGHYGGDSPAAAQVLHGEGGRSEPSEAADADTAPLTRPRRRRGRKGALARRRGVV